MGAMDADAGTVGGRPSLNPLPNGSPFRRTNHRLQGEPGGWHSEWDTGYGMHAMGAIDAIGAMSGCGIFDFRFSIADFRLAAGYEIRDTGWMRYKAMNAMKTMCAMKPDALK